MVPKTSLMTHRKSFLLFILLTSFIISTSCTLLPVPPVETKFTLYFNIILTGPNANFARVAGIPGNRWSIADFGAVYGTDTVITESLSPNAPIVARAQGLFSISSVDASNAFTTFSLVFINNANAGSTLEIHGRFALNAIVSELSITSGTGKFRFASGYAVATTLAANSAALLVRADITVRRN